MAPAQCILVKFLEVGCHYFPPAFKHSHFRRQVPPRSKMTRDIPAAKGGTVGEKFCPVILPKWRFPRHLGIKKTRHIETRVRQAHFQQQSNACFVYTLCKLLLSVTRNNTPNSCTGRPEYSGVLGYNAVSLG